MKLPTTKTSKVRTVKAWAEMDRKKLRRVWVGRNKPKYDYQYGNRLDDVRPCKITYSL